MTLANDGAGSIDRVLLSALAASVSADELAALRTEAGFQDPNEFDFDSLIGPLSNCAFPAEHHCYDIMWAVHECGLSALERYSAPLRQYLAALYLHCNRLRAWGLNVEADYHHMLAAATLDAPSAAAPVMAFLERLADPVGAAEGFDPRLAHFGWLLLHCALGMPDTDASLAKRDLLFAPMHADLRADLGVAERSTEDWERLFVRACAKGGRSCGGFAELFFGNTVPPPSP